MIWLIMTEQEIDIQLKEKYKVKECVSISYAERLQRYRKNAVAIYQRIQEKPISVQQVANYMCAYQKIMSSKVKNGTEIEDTRLRTV